MHFDERRQHPRFPILMRVVLRVGVKRKKARATLMDLSVGGMFVKTKVKVKLARPIEVSFRARPDMVCEARGRIVRVFDTTMLRGFGVGFDETNDTFAKFLAVVAKLDPEPRTEFLKQVLEREVEIR